MRIRAVSSLSDATAAWRLCVFSIVAIAVSVGVFLIARHSARQSADTAELSFDSSVAARGDSAVAHAAQPALTLAQSMLTETTVLSVLRQAGAYPSDPAVGIGEFRSRLELQQPSGSTLQIVYHDSNPLAARKVANAVADAIVNWHPAITQSPATAQPVIASRPALSVRARASSHTHDDPLRAAYIAVANLERQLAATNEKIETLSRVPASRPQTPSATPQPSVQSDQRRTLQAKLAADRQKLDELRLRYTDEYPDVENLKDQISDLQQELAALPPETAHPSRANAAPASEKDDAEIADLRLNRARLSDQISAKEDAIANMRLHPDSQLASPPPGTASVPPASSAVTTPAPTRIETAAWQNPFKIARLADLTGGSWAWPAILASSLCILLLAVSVFFILEPWRRRMHSMYPAYIALEDNPSAHDSHSPTTELPAQPAPVAQEHDEHAVQEPDWEWTSEAVAAKELSAISLVEPEQQSTYAEKTMPEVVDTEPIMAAVSEAQEISPVHAVSETGLTSPEASNSDSEATDTEPVIPEPSMPVSFTLEPFMPASLSMPTLDTNPESEPHSEFAETQMQAEIETEHEPASPPEWETKMMSWFVADLESEPAASAKRQPSISKQKNAPIALADSDDVDSEWIARTLRDLSQTSTVHMLELQRRGGN